MNFIDRYTPRLHALFSARLARLPMARHPALFVRPSQQGYCDYAFGGRAGPDIAPTHLFHDLAHAAQFGPDAFRTRAHVSGFAFKVPRRYIFQQLVSEPQTMQATQREVDTFGYQLHLMRAAGCRISDRAFFEDNSRAMSFMHDWYWVPGEDEDARRDYLVNAMAESYARVTQAEALDRLEGWLDKTRARLKRVGKAMLADPYSKAKRYALDSTGVLVPLEPNQVFAH